tara:strand:- start:6673 stop:7500 length:828 start_codon:yes stop_codon:yes gene_type:complete
MMSKHNKKRNVGIVYQQVLRRAAEAAIDGDKPHVNECVELLGRHFRPGTELYKEHKLFSSILETGGVDEKTSEKVLSIVKEVSRSIDQNVIEKQKGTFINEANRVFGKGQLFNTRVSNYRGLATVQLLLNEWRNPGTLTPTQTAEYERRLQAYMITEKQVPTLQKESKVDDLTVAMFRKRFDDSYGSKLSNLQKNFVAAVAFNKHDVVEQMISEAKDKAIELLDRRHLGETNKLLSERYEIVRKNIIAFNGSSESTASMAMTLFNLIKELESGDV